MRSAITIATLMLYSSLASGQERPYQNSEALNYELTQGMFNKSRAEAMKANLGLQNWKLVDEFNQRNVTLKDERELWLARYRIYENVISLRGKDEVMKWVDDARSKLAASELEGYQRLGVHNPYNTRSYLRYYDHQTGELVASEVRGTYEDLERQRLDFEKQRERQLETQRSINAAYEQAMELYDKALAAKRDRDEAYQANAKARTNLGRGSHKARCRVLTQPTRTKLRLLGDGPQAVISGPLGRMVRSRSEARETADNGKEPLPVLP